MQAQYGYVALDTPTLVHAYNTHTGNSYNPMWHAVGSDSKDYFVGVDLSVHVQSDLPIAKGQP